MPLHVRPPHARAAGARPLLVALALLSSCLLAGCSKKDHVTAPIAWTAPTIGTANEAALRTLAGRFSGRTSSERRHVRNVLVDSLNHGWSGVDRAELAADSTTIAIRFSDGHIGAINTNPALGLGASYDPTAMRNAFLDLTPARGHAVARASASRAQVLRGHSPRTPASRTRVAVPAALYRFAPHARKVLLLDAAAGGYAYDEDTALLDYVKDYLVSQRGYAAADVVIKANRVTESYGTLDFEDFFRLKDYGLVVIVARSLDWDMPSDPNDWSSPRVSHYWVQVADANGYNYRRDPAHGGGGAERIDVQAELAKGRIVEASETPLVGGTPICYYMRDDLWQEQMNGNLPGSVVVLLSPHGWAAQPVFGFRQASSFSSWTDSVSTQRALDSAWLPLFMAQGDASDAETALNGVLPRSDGASDFRVWPGMPTMVYLPTWADVATLGAPAGTQTVRVTAAYTSSEVMAPDAPTIEDVPSAVKNFTAIVPSQAMRFTAQALDASGTVLGEAHVDTTLRCGDNDVTLRFTPAASGVSLETSALLIDTRNPFDLAITAAVRDEQGRPIQGRQVLFSRVPAAGSFVGANPATTNASGNASVVLHTDYIPPSGTITVKVIAKDQSTSKADTVAVRYCDGGKYIVWLAGTADHDLFWQTPAGDFAVSHADLRRTVNGDGPYGVADMTGPTQTSFPLSGYYSSGDVILFHVRAHLGMTASIGPLFVHVYNCFRHEVTAAGTINVPTSGEQTFTVTVP